MAERERERALSLGEEEGERERVSSHVRSQHSKTDQAPLSSFGQNMNSPSPAQPPPPRSPPPPHMTPWRRRAPANCLCCAEGFGTSPDGLNYCQSAARTYKTQSGLPYYHNTQTAQTVWETCQPSTCPRGQHLLGDFARNASVAEECPTEFVPPPGNAHAAGLVLKHDEAMLTHARQELPTSLTLSSNPVGGDRGGQGSRYSPY